MDLNQETNRTSKDLGNGIDNEQTYKRDVEKKGSPASSEEKLKRRIKENRDIEPIESTFMPEEMVLVPRNTKFDISIVSVLPDYLLLPEEQARFIGKDDEKKCKGGWEIGLMTTPSIANKILKTDGTNGWLVNRDFFGISNGSERATLGFQTSLTVQFNLSSKWFIQSGITYSEKRESVSYNHIIKDEIIVSQTERKLLYLPAPKVQWINVTGSANNKYSFLELPFYAGFKHSFNNKLEWRLRGGVSYLRLLAKEGIKVDPTLLVLNDLSESKIYTKSNIGFAINSGVYYKLGPAMKILIEPGASISITNLTRIGSPLVTRPYNYGLNIGLQYIIK